MWWAENRTVDRSCDDDARELFYSADVPIELPFDGKPLPLYFAQECHGLFEQSVRWQLEQKEEREREKRRIKEREKYKEN